MRTLVTVAAQGGSRALALPRALPAIELLMEAWRKVALNVILKPQPGHFELPVLYGFTSCELVAVVRSV